jgi:hypothetical protein
MNRWKNYVWMAAGVAALTVVGTFTAKPLLAQIKAALVQSVDEPGRNPYSSVGAINCLGGSLNLCLAYFTTVPPGKRLVVTNIIGMIYLATPGVVTNASLAQAVGPSATSSPLLQFPTSLQAGTFAGDNITGINAAIRTYFESGAQPVIVFGGSTPIDLTGTFGLSASSITLSGYYINVP